MISVFDSVENIVAKGKTAGNKHFLLFSLKIFYPSQNKYQVFLVIYLTGLM